MTLAEQMAALARDALRAILPLPEGEGRGEGEGTVGLAKSLTIVPNTL